MAQTLVAVSLEELTQIVRQAVRDEMKHDAPEAAPNKNWLTTAEVAKHFDVAEVTVQSWVKHGDCPHYDVGGLRRFELSAVDRWFRNRPEKNRNRKREVLPAR